MIGKALREKREAMGISREEASSRTQIKLEFLQSLEEESFDSLPDPSYLMGFLRRYAHYLELDADGLVEEFHRQISKPLMATFGPIPRASPPAWRKWGRPLILILLLLLISALFFLSIYVIPHRAPKGAFSPAPETAPRTSSSPPGEVKRESSPPPAVEQPAVPPAQGKGHALSLYAVEMTWLVIQADDGPVREILLLRGQSFSLSARRQFRLTLGNAGGVEMVLDGKRLPTSGSSGQVIRDLILPAKGRGG
jgi:transcriptional regulator with XRE-family HTH domain